MVQNATPGKIKAKELMQDLVRRCPMCDKDGSIPYEGSFFCGEDHLKMYKERIKIAAGEMKDINACSVCGKSTYGRFEMISIGEKGETFTPLKLCSVKCFEAWEPA